MFFLRHVHTIARCVLVWFALSLGAAIASPLVKPQALQLVCSNVGSVKLIASNADGTSSTATHTLDCPLCTGLGTVPPLQRTAFAHVSPMAYAMPEQTPHYLGFMASAPPPARGPPLSA